jgi:CxxC motif-containing protein (DUF1111 family)
MRTSVYARAVASVSVVFVATLIIATRGESQSFGGPTEAPTGFVVESNGFAEEFCARQGELANSNNSPMIPGDECNFAAAVEQFTEAESVEDGLGPIFNASGCAECHLVPILGGSSQVTEKRAGFYDGVVFFEPPGGSLIQDRAIPSSLQELTIPSRTNVTTFRSSVNVLGDGFVEAINSNTLAGIASRQPASMRGLLIQVPVGESNGLNRTGRFGWKDQQASLVSFSADAYVNEMGITSPLQPDEPTSNGTSVAEFDTVPDPDDDGVDVELFALFMRSTLAPPRDLVRAATADARDGRQIFDNLGCDTCHIPTIATAAPGTVINGGALKVAEALGNKIIHPFGDFLLHDVGTGDGIVQNGGDETRNLVRTAPLWGLRTRGRFMHDALSFNLTDAIRRHGNQARPARDAFNALRAGDRNKLIAFLLSL